MSSMYDTLSNSLFRTQGIRVVDAVKRKEIYQELMKQLDKEENDFMPQVTVSEHYLNFERVHFYERVQRSFEITNTGPVTVRFLFKEQPKGRRYAKDWLKADPHNGTLKKGESVSSALYFPSVHGRTIDCRSSDGNHCRFYLT